MPKDRAVLTKVKEKLLDIRTKGYVGKNTSLISSFDVPKGGDDIRMVYDGTKSDFHGVFVWRTMFER